MINLKRKNGFLQIEDYESIRNCSKEEGQNAYDWFRLNQKEYFFKVGSPEECFYEYVWYQILQEMQIETVEYDLAKHQGFLGLISPNYNPNNAPKKTIAELLYTYKSFLQKEKGIKKSIEDLYNLNHIKQMISWYYQKEKSEVIESLKEKIIFRFILQIICGDKDLHANNIEIYSPEYPVLSPIFDMREYGKINNQQEYRLKLNATKGFESPTKTIHKFLKTATIKEKEILQEYQEKLQEIKLRKIMKFISEKLEVKISAFTQLYYEQMLKKTVKNLEICSRKI